VNLAPIHIILAQGIEISHTAPSPVAQSAWMAVSDVVLIVGAGLGVAALLIIWVLYTRKRRRSSHHHHHQRHERPSAPIQPVDSEEEEDEPEDSPSHEHRHRRRRVRRRDHRPRNPTLAETGGLPPVRPVDATPPPPAL
jgi:hypothetical protein